MAKTFSANFGGGMNRLASPFLVRPTEVKLARNVDLETIGAVSKRKGYGLGLEVQSGKEVLGLHEYVISSSGAKYLLAIANNSGGTFAALKYATDPLSSFTAHGDANVASLLANAEYEFANFIDVCFIVGSTSSAFQQIFTIAGVLSGDYSATQYVSGAPNAKYIVQTKDRIFLANTSNSQSELFWSDLPTGSPGSWALTWTSTNNTRVETNDGEVISGLGANFNRVLIFKPNGIQKWDPDNEEMVKEKGDIGTTSHRSIKNIGQSTIFYKAGYGFYDYKQDEPELISRRIQDFIAATPGEYKPRAEADDRNYYATGGDITVGGRTYTNVLYHYDYLLSAWTVYENFGASVIAKFGPTDKKTLYFGGESDGKVYEMFSYTTTSTSTSTSSTSSTSSSTSSTSTTTT